MENNDKKTIDQFTKEEIDMMIDGIKKAIKLLKK